MILNKISEKKERLHLFAQKRDTGMYFETFNYYFKRPLSLLHFSEQPQWGPLGLTRHSGRRRIEKSLQNVGRCN